MYNAFVMAWLKCVNINKLLSN